MHLYLLRFPFDMYVITFWCAMTGDQVSRKGGMTGGFYDHRRSKLRLMNTIIQNMKSIDTKEKVLEDVRRQLQDILSIIYFGLIVLFF